VWQAHYPVPASEGYLVSQNGQLYGSPHTGNAIAINCQTPKVYLATGNCLIGNPNGTGNMPYAWFHTGRCVQMFGYIIETNYEYLGWGQWFRFSEFPGVYNVAESWFITNNSMVFDLYNKTSGVYNQSMMTEFLDNTVVYGDPRAVAYMYDLGDSSHPYLEKFKRSKGAGAAPDTFEYTATGHLTSGPTSNGTAFYYGLRPFWYLPARIDPATVTIQKNDGHTAVVTENFMLWSMLEGNTEALAKGASKVLRWTAKAVEEMTPVQSPDVKVPAVRSWCRVRQCPNLRGIEILRGGMREAELAVRIYNATGKVVIERIVLWTGNSPEESRSIGMGDAARGMYYVELHAQGKVHHEAFVLMR
jgi:hypothetical protein